MLQDMNIALTVSRYSENIIISGVCFFDSEVCLNDMATLKGTRRIMINNPFNWVLFDT
jgi:hypothetical protein